MKGLVFSLARKNGLENREGETGVTVGLLILTLPPATIPKLEDAILDEMDGYRLSLGVTVGREGVIVGREGVMVGREGVIVGREGMMVGREGVGREGVMVGREGVMVGREGVMVGREGVMVGREGVMVGRENDGRSCYIGSASFLS